jgi:predicted dienelactone hydrolase
MMPAARLLRRSLISGGPALLAARSAYGDGYDPTVPGPQSAAADHVYDLTVPDPARNRTIALRIAHSARRQRMPVILFSHGLGGNRHGPAYLERRWRARGYVTVFLQHPGSDDAVWREAAPAERRAALRAAATPAQLLHRMQDVVAVLDALARWQAAGEHRPLGERMDLARIGMSGHSFGALTTQAVAGQQVSAALPGTWPDPRLKAALILSPGAPARMPAAEAFGQVAIPWMLMTGTHDGSPIGPPPNRLGVFPALPPGRKYELVLDQAEHSAFADTALPGESLARDPNHHRAILALGTAFWDSTLKADPHAQAWLDGPGPATVLAPQDRWQRK